MVEGKGKRIEEALRGFQLKLCKKIARPVFTGPDVYNGEDEDASYKAAKAYIDAGEIPIIWGISLMWREDDKDVTAEDHTVIPTRVGEFSFKVRRFAMPQIDREYKYVDCLTRLSGETPIHRLPQHKQDSHIYIVGEKDDEYPYDGRNGKAVVAYGTRPSNSVIHISAIVLYSHSMPWKYETKLTRGGRITYLEAKLKREAPEVERKQKMLDQAIAKERREDEERRERERGSYGPGPGASRQRG